MPAWLWLLLLVLMAGVAYFWGWHDGEKHAHDPRKGR